MLYYDVQSTQGASADSLSDKLIAGVFYMCIANSLTVLLLLDRCHDDMFSMAQ